MYAEIPNNNINMNHQIFWEDAMPPQTASLTIVKSLPSSKLLLAENNKNSDNKVEKSHIVAGKYNLDLTQVKVWDQEETDEEIDQELYVIESNETNEDQNKITIDPKKIHFDNRMNNDKYHKVVKGDTLYNIAQKYQTDVEKIKAWNQIKNNMIYVDQELLVSKKDNSPAKPNLPADNTAAITHKVATGDTLGSLSKKYGVSIGQLKAWNQLNDDTIRFGQVLIVGQKNVTPSKPNEENQMSTTHIVQQGDTLYGISKKYGISIQQIKNWNQLTSDMIFANQKLIVKAPSSTPNSPEQSNKPEINHSGTTHKVIKGDTLYSISKKYGISVDELRSWNQLKNDLIVVNQVLTVKKGNSVAKPETPSQMHHTVVAGDTLYKISKKYGVTVEELRSWNQLKNDLIVVNQVLTVKKGSSTPQDNKPTKEIMHQVVKGESLYGIGKKYGVSVSRIKELNKLSNDVIYVGQTLKVQ